MKWKILICCGTVVVLVGVFCFLPCWSVARRSYNCRLCAARKTTKTTRVLGVPVWVHRGDVRRCDVTELYGQYIGVPHEHEWAGGGYSRTSGTICGTALHSCGFHMVQPFPPWQRRLTYTALKAVAQVKDWSKQQRTNLFLAILDCTSRDAYEKVAEVFAQAQKGGAKQIWRQWLDEKTGSQQSAIEGS